MDSEPSGVSEPSKPEMVIATSFGNTAGQFDFTNTLTILFSCVYGLDISMIAEMN